MKQNSLNIRAYEKKDCQELYRLYQDTVRNVNSRDYLPEQIEAWLSASFEEEAWNRRFLESRTLVAEKQGKILGFANMGEKGFLDCLYVHKDFQGQGIGGKLLRELECSAADEENGFFTFASLTARSFFENCGYQVVCENFAERSGVLLKNFRMEKSRSQMEGQRRRAVEALLACDSEEELSKLLWEVFCLYEGAQFFTSKGLPFRYRIRGGELFCDRKAKSITQASVTRAYQKILAGKAAGDPITGPKKLGSFGAPYIWSIFRTVGLL